MLKKEAGLFLIVGTLTVVVDYLSYRTIVWLGAGYALSKALGFISGTIFAYFANRHVTFGHVDHAPNSMYRFIALYLTTLGANVLVNQYVLYLTNHSQLGVNIAFLFATGISATLNFLGMKYFVFKAKAVTSDEF